MLPFEHSRKLLHLLKAFERMKYLKCFDGCNITRYVLWKYLLIIVLTSHLNVVIRSPALTTWTKSVKPSVGFFSHYIQTILHSGPLSWRCLLKSHHPILLYGTNTTCDSLRSRILNDPTLWGRLWGHLISSHLMSEPLMVQISSYRPGVIGVDWPIASGLEQQVWDGDNSHPSGALTWQPAANIDWGRSRWNINFLYVTFRSRHMFNSRLTDWREKLRNRAAARHIARVVKTKNWCLGNRCRKTLEFM